MSFFQILSVIFLLFNFFELAQTEIPAYLVTIVETETTGEIIGTGVLITKKIVITACSSLYRLPLDKKLEDQTPTDKSALRIGTGDKDYRVLDLIFHPKCSSAESLLHILNDMALIKCDGPISKSVGLLPESSVRDLSQYYSKTPTNCAMYGWSILKDDLISGKVEYSNWKICSKKICEAMGSKPCDDYIEPIAGPEIFCVRFNQKQASEADCDGIRPGGVIECDKFVWGVKKYHVCPDELEEWPYLQIQSFVTLADFPDVDKLLKDNANEGEGQLKIRHRVSGGITVFPRVFILLMIFL